MLVRQLRSPLLVLLLVAATVSFFVGERSDAVIIGVIVTLSVGLGFVNEYRAERAAQALHSQLRHRAVVRRDGCWTSLGGAGRAGLVRFMGTIVRAGSAEAVVVATGARTEFGRIAVELGERQEETQFQAGLRRFSGLLARVAGVAR